MDPGSLDSFIDVVCNLIGGLLLIALITALSTGGKVFDVFTPVEHNVENGVSVIFAVTSEGIFPLEDYKSVPELLERVTSSEGMDRELDTQWFHWELVIGSARDFAVTCKLKEGAIPPITDARVDAVRQAYDRGEAENRKRKPGAFCFAFFLVAPDDAAFRLFRLARKELWGRNVQVGWMPLNIKEGLSFSSRGGGHKPLPQ